MFQTGYQIFKLIEVVGGKITGRKKLQKLFYIMEHLGFPVFLDYSYYRYGPYSYDLSMIASELDRNEFLKETYVNATYEYEITKEGKDFFEFLEKNGMVKRYDMPEKFVKTASYILEQDATLLELVSTILYLREYGDSFEDACEEALKLKPHLSGYLEDAKKFILSLEEMK